MAFFAISWNLTRSETGLVDMKAAQQTGAVPSGSDVEMGDPKLDRFLKKPNPVAAYETEQKALPAGKRDNWLQRRVTTRLLQAGKQTAGPNADQYIEAFIQKMVANVPKGMFVLMPLFAGLLKLIYWRSRRYDIEHVVFALHTHAFAFAVVTLDIFLDQPWWHYTAPAAVWLYFLLAMKTVYRQGWVKTLVKLGILTVAYLVLLSLTLAGVFVATFFG